MTADLLAAKLELGDLLDKVKRLFKPGNKVTLVIRNPGLGDADLVIGDDDLSEAVAAIERLKSRPNL